MTKKTRKKKTGESHSGDLQLLDDLIRCWYEAVVTQSEENAKLGDLLKMIELRRKLTPHDASQKELWKLLEKVRRDVLGGRAPAGKKNHKVPEENRADDRDE